jgi:CRP/FNR family cyclic AMP-dependent transcriptional regulator
MKTILLIEDNNDIRENMAEIIEMANYKVLTAPDGKQGVELALKSNPDLVVCDIMMPVLDGYGVLHMLHKSPDLKNTPFIFLSAMAERSEVRKGMELGADDYITKPCSGTELLNAIESRLKKADLAKQQLPPGLNGVNTLIQTISGNKALKELVKDRDVNDYAKRQTIYSEGKEPFRLFYIEKGKVKTFKTNEDGKELITGLYSAGDFLGHIALLEEANYKDSAEALEDTEITSIPRAEFEQLVNSNPEVMKKFVQMLAKNVTEKEQQLLNLAYYSLRKKVAETLIKVYKKYNVNGDERFSIDLNRENLANIAGTAKESLIRTLSDFKDEKLIDINQGNIIILNEKKLEKLIN